MLTELHELGVYPADVAELGRSKLWEIGLYNLVSMENMET